LFAENVGVSGVLGEFSKDLEQECPDRVVAATVDDGVELKVGRGFTRLLASLLVCLLN
jgi:hypothetical protein